MTVVKAIARMGCGVVVALACGDDGGSSNGGSTATGDSSATSGTSATSGNGAGTASGTTGTTTGADTSATGDGDTGTSGGGVDGCRATEVFANDFDDDDLGTYADLADFNDPPWDNGVGEGRVEIIEGPDAFDGRSLRVHYPTGGVGPGEGGAQWMTPLGQSYDELFLAYRLRFASGFDFVLGGKLPGLVGGTAPTGCVADDTGFSARGMWRTDGEAVQYMYWPDKVAACGDDYPYMTGAETLKFEPGTWHTVEHRIVINTPGQADGILQAWVDGELVLDVQDFLYRRADGDYSIDAMYFSTFFGGSSPEWGPTADETIDFDDFVICTGPITHA